MGLLEETKKLSIENAVLKQQLKEAMESIDAIKTGNIDALVIAHEKALKVYTEKTSDKYYRILIEKMHEGAVTLNDEGTILYCNSYFAKMVNLPLHNVIGTIFKNFVDDASKERFDEYLDQGSVNAIKEEINLSAGDIKAIPVLMSINTLTLDNNKVLSIILTDLTILHENQDKLKRRKKQLEQKNRELEKTNKVLAFQIEEKEKRTAELIISNTIIRERDELIAHKESILAILSHDLRSPLSGIIGIAEHLRSNFDEMEIDKVKRLLDLLYQSSQNELNMLDYLLEWARIKYASEAFSPVNIILKAHVMRVFEMLNENAVVNNIQLHHRIDAKINVSADGKMLLSILQNIISNAIKFTDPGGKIIVTAKRKEDKISIEVKDTGIGMSEDVKNKLFTPQMSSLSNARKENRGAGIGLLLAKGFVEKNGGEIWVKSIEGKGSSFFFTLPVKNPLNKIDNADKLEIAESA